MRTQKRHYNPEFKQKAVDLSYDCGHVTQVCKELDIPTSVFHRWRRELKKYGKNSFPRKGIANLLNQNFKVQRKNQALKSYITYIHTKQGWLYLPVIIDLYHRKIVGWSLSYYLTTEDTIVKAWYMAVNNDPITGELIFHSDRGSQYASECFRNILKRYNGLVCKSMSRKGNCWHNAVAESFFKTLKVEWVYKHNYLQKSQVELSIFEWIET